MSTLNLSLLAGMVSTALFASSSIPMLLKAFQSKDLRSYSLTHMVLSNIGNGFHWLYIVGLPFGPIWFLHSFYTISTALMLLWYLQHRHMWADRQ